MLETYLFIESYLVANSALLALSLRALVITLFYTGFSLSVDNSESIVIVPPPCISILPSPSNVCPLIVLMLVPETN
jgi:hypothetical protein